MTRLGFAVVLLLASGGPAAARDVKHLTLAEAEKLAAENHPLVRASHYATLAAGETVREARSAYFPTVYGAVTGAKAPDGTRIAAGGLNNPTILSRVATGFSVSQLLTDFGRTSNLVGSERLHADAQQQDEESRRESVRLDVDRAYFEALRAQAVLRVAKDTVDARQLVVDQVSALAQSNLKSGLDVSFAKVNLGEAQLLLVQARNDVQASYASLADAMGSSEAATYELEDEPMPPAPPADSAPLVTEALKDRPDVATARLDARSAMKFADAERALWFPTVAAIGAAGVTPTHVEGLNDNYSAIGVNVTVPLTNGNLFAARHAQAIYAADAQAQQLADLENRVTRDVTVAWLDARTAYQRLDLTTQLLTQAKDALDLAQARYKLGLSSIVELTQGQLNETEAEIEQATARYVYQARTSALRFQLGQLR